jgi:hypothetical protein
LNRQARQEQQDNNYRQKKAVGVVANPLRVVDLIIESFLASLAILAVRLDIDLDQSSLGG